MSDFDFQGNRRPVFPLTPVVKNATNQFIWRVWILFIFLVSVLHQDQLGVGLRGSGLIFEVSLVDSVLQKKYFYFNEKFSLIPKHNKRYPRSWLEFTNCKYIVGC